jgi:integrase
MQHEWENVERGLYRDKRTGQYYERIRSGGNTWLALDTTKLVEARERLDARRAVRSARKLGIKVRDPDKPVVTVSATLDRFEHDGCPNKSGHPRQDLTQPKSALPFLKKFFGELPVDNLTQKTLDDYHDWRVKQTARSAGHRTTDLDLQILSVAISWAKRKDMVKTNPIESHQRYTDPRTVRHAKDVAPTDMAEVHKMAREYFQRPNSQVLGWQLLFAAMTGQRTEELLALRSDAAAEDPGWITKDGQSLYVRRVKNPTRENPCVFIHKDLKRLLKAHAKWKTKRYPTCGWYFPGRDGENVLSDGALAKSLKKREGKQVTPHGLRALYVRIRRSNGIQDSQIAWEINHTSGVSTLEGIYGGVPPHWMTGKGPKLAWIPSAPAWQGFEDWS